MRLIGRIGLNRQDKDLVSFIKQTTGYNPKNLSLYKLAFIHTSVDRKSAGKYLKLKSSLKDTNNERLEYLGDAVLDTIIADYLFHLYPFEDEGFLTQLRSKIVNREQLNFLARKIGLENHLIIDSSARYSRSKSVYGNALEAFIGSLYLDKGFIKTKKFIVKRLLERHLDIDYILEHDKNYKSLVLEWGQQTRKAIEFSLSRTEGRSHNKVYYVDIIINNQIVAQGNGRSKKKAEQLASERAYQKLNIQ